MDVKLREISVIQVQKIINSIRDKYDLETPAYDMQLPNGDTQTVEYDEESIADPNTPPEDVEKWHAYKRKLQEVQNEINEKTTAYAFYKGVECEVDEEWIAEQKWLELDLPEDRRDLKVQYIMTEILPTAYDIKKALIDIMKLSSKGADPQAIKAAEDTFLSTVEA